MLQKDGEVIRKGFRNLFKEEFDLIDKKDTRVVFKLINSIHNGKDRIPRSYSIPTETRVFDEGGDASEYVYYHSKQTKVVNGVMQDIFSPGLLTFSPRGDFSVDIEKDPDLFIFMMKNSRRALGKNGDGTRKAIFYLEDKTAESKERVAKRAASIQMQKYLYDPEARLSDDKLRTIAQALRVAGIDENTSIELVQTSIEDKVKNNPQLFLGMKEFGAEVQMRANLQQAAERGILSFNTKTYRWILVDSDSGNKADLAVVKKTEDTMAALVYWLKNTDDNDHYGKIVELLTGKPSERVSNKQEESELDKQLKLQEMKNKELELQVKLAEANKGNSSDVSPKEEEDLPIIDDMDIDEIKEQFAKPHGVKYNHLTTKEKLIENLNDKVEEKDRTWVNKEVQE